jgi:hypothetical protein
MDLRGVSGEPGRRAGSLAYATYLKCLD